MKKNKYENLLKDACDELGKIQERVGIVYRVLRNIYQWVRESLSEGNEDDFNLLKHTLSIIDMHVRDAENLVRKIGENADG